MLRFFLRCCFGHLALTTYAAARFVQLPAAGKINEHSQTSPTGHRSNHLHLLLLMRRAAAAEKVERREGHHRWQRISADRVAVVGGWKLKHPNQPLDIVDPVAAAAPAAAADWLNRPEWDHC